MDEHTKRQAPQHVIEALDASVEDIAAGRVHDADAVQAEARRMLADHESGMSKTALPRRATTSGRTRATR